MIKRYLLAVTFFLGLAGNLCASEFFANLKAEYDTLTYKITVKQADKKYEGLFYVKAINKYKKVVNKGFTSDSVLRNLGISYLKVNQTDKAEDILKMLINSNEAIPSDYYFYAQALKYNQKYEEADKWVGKYKSLCSNDSRGELQYKAEPVIKDLLSLEKYAIKPVSFNSEYSDFGAVVLDSFLVFTSGRKDQGIIQYDYSWKEDPYLDIFSVKEENHGLLSKTELLSKGINSRFHDGPICYSTDGEEVFVTRNVFHYGVPKYSEEKENHFQLYYGTKDGAGWSELEALPFNSSEYSCGHPSISSDNQTLYFASDMPGGYGGADIYMVQRVDSGWGNPQNLGADINTEGDEMFPFISNKGTLYFSSNGHLGIGGLDVFMAEKVGDNSYGVLNLGAPLNSSADDFSFYLKADGVNGYFASNRSGGKGDDDIYKFEILAETVLMMQLVGTTKNRETNEIIPNANVAVIDDSGKEILKIQSNDEGDFTCKVAPGRYYTISATKDKHTPAELNLMADKAKAENNIQKVDVLLDEEHEWGVYGFVYQKETGTGIEDVEIVITSKDKSDGIKAVTNSDGNFRELLQSDTDYDIVLKKSKYFTRRGEFSTKGMKPGWINVKEFIEMAMEEIVVGKTIEIPNIYYDLAKWNIREDAAIELEKVVQFMLDNKTITIELGSHTDCRGSNSANQTLSQKRAESAVNYIVGHDVRKDRISAKGYGEEKLKNRCANGVNCSEVEHQENRRTEIKIIDF